MKKGFFPILDREGHPRPAADVPAIDGCNYFTGVLPGDATAGVTLLGEEKSGWEAVWARMGGAAPAPAFPENAKFCFIAQINSKSVIHSAKSAQVFGDYARLEWERATFTPPPGEQRSVSYCLLILPHTNGLSHRWSHADIEDEKRREWEAANNKRVEAELRRKKRFRDLAAQVPKLL